MSRGNVQRRWRSAIVLAILAAGLAALAAACGGGGGSTTPATTAAAPPASTGATETTAAPPTSTGATETGATPTAGNFPPMIQQEGMCGDPTKQGQKATGTPIKIGGIYSDTPIVAFSPILDAAKAYFDCVNDNGGIGGRPIDYIMVPDNGDGNKSHSAAVQLWESDKVLGMTGNTSFVDCAVNHTYYEKNHIYAIVAGASDVCFNTPNIAAVNQGPSYSVGNATNYGINEASKTMPGWQKPTKIVCAYAASVADTCNSAKYLAGKYGLPYVGDPLAGNLTDPASLVTRWVQEAGSPTGAILPAFTSNILDPVFPVVEQQGLIDKAQWMEGATGTQSDVLATLSNAWTNHYFAQSEFELPTGTGPDQSLLRDKIIPKYAPKLPFSNFSDMGFLSAKWMTEALLRLNAAGTPLTQQSVNNEVHNLIGLKSDILCKLWYFGNFPTHVPNNASVYATVKDHKPLPLGNGQCVANPITDKAIANAYVDEAQLGIPQVPGAPTAQDAQAFLAGNS